MYTCEVSDRDAARAYYQANTAGFLRWGQGGKARVIHRAVWAPGVHDRAGAFAWAHRRAWRAAPCEPARVLDLGCGVGAGVQAMLGYGAASAVGVTISEAQVELARAALPVGAPARVVCADFCALPDLGPPFDLVFAIEAFVHASSPGGFFCQAAAQLRPGARLVIIDDVRSELPASAEQARWLEAFEQGWRTPALSTRRQMRSWAASAGLRLQHDERLSAFLELGRPRDKAISALVRARAALPGQGLPGERASAWWGNLEGGNALQRCLRAELIDYRCMVFTREKA